MDKELSKRNQLLIGLYVGGTVLLCTLSLYVYQMLFTPNLNTDKPDTMLYVPKGANWAQVMDSLKTRDLVQDELSFAFLAKVIGCQENIKPGAYALPKNTTNKEFLWRFKNGRQSPIKFTFNNVRLKDEFIAKLDSKFEASADEFAQVINNPENQEKWGVNDANVVALFIPNTYEFYWNKPADEVVEKLVKEHRRFWNEERQAKAKALNLTKQQVAILASITEAETKKLDEMPVVAGVYYNRYKINMPLQADPTVVYAVGDFTIKRVLKVHKAKQSPYNTYINMGLPPGPIAIPSITAIDAVLNLKKHDYLYFCAKEDFSGYHNFAVDYATQMRNAAIYQAALDKAGIK